ncbi:MAG TPA: DUF3465 domain-containing protein [Steroidobacteraceae bacterium]|nr:DUF3465 domain-containing protein [Steroidobacteraceae bacterium]
MKWGLVVVFAAVVAAVGGRHLQESGQRAGTAPAQQSAAPGASQQSGAQVRVTGRVVRVLADDRDGSPHQRFIIEADTGGTLLVAHNLDLAPRLDGLAVGERLVVSGEYQWNKQGGLIHWTHDDPQRRHAPGYIEWRGRRYE